MVFIQRNWSKQNPIGVRHSHSQCHRSGATLRAAPGSRQFNFRYYKTIIHVFQWYNIVSNPGFFLNCYFSWSPVCDHWCFSPGLSGREDIAASHSESTVTSSLQGVTILPLNAEKVAEQHLMYVFNTAFPAPLLVCRIGSQNWHMVTKFTEHIRLGTMVQTEFSLIKVSYLSNLKEKKSVTKFSTFPL